MKISNLIFLGLLFLLAGCGAKPEGTSSVKLQIGGISGLMAAGSSVQFDGGVIVVGHTLDDSQAVRVVFNNGAEDRDIILKKGEWEFAAIGWSKNLATDDLFTGVNRCAYKRISVLNDDVSVDFNFTRANCGGFPIATGNLVFSQSSFLETVSTNVSQFMRLNLVSCNSLLATVDSTTGRVLNPSCESNTAGISGSARIVVHGGYKDSQNNDALGVLYSQCVNFTSGKASTDLRLPVGDVSDRIFNYEVQLFSSTNCTSAPLTYRFFDSSVINGMMGFYQKAGVQVEDVNPSTPIENKVVLYLEHNATTQEEMPSFNSLYGDGHNGALAWSSNSFNLGDQHYLKLNNITKTAGVTSYNVTNEVLKTATGTFSAGDEVFWYVTKATYGTSLYGCTSNHASPVFGDFVSGMGGFAKVQAVQDNGSYITGLVLDHPIHVNYPVNGVKTLLNEPVIGSNCSIQFVKVFNWSSVSTSYNTSHSIIPYSYNGTFSKGGITAFRIREKISLAQMSTLNIAQYANSFPSGTDYSHCGSFQYQCYSPGSGTVGGGIVIGRVRVIDVGNASVLNLDVGGQTSSGGGFLDFAVSDLLPPPPGTSSVVGNIQLNAYGPASNGVLYFNYCQKSSMISTLNVTYSYNGANYAATKVGSGDGFIQKKWVCAQ